MNSIANVAVVAALFCQAVPAQSPSRPQHPTGTTISVHYKGGTLAAFLDLVREEYPGANIVASPAAKDVEVPELKIQNASLYAALRAVASIAPAEFHVNVIQERHGLGQPVISVRVSPAGRSVPSPRRSRKSSSLPVVSVFSIKNMITVLPGLPKEEGMKLESQTILLAIDTGLGVEDAKVKATVRYHEASGLLFVRGTNAQTRLVEQIIAKLESDLERRRNARRVADNMKKHLASKSK